jgi:hypothetical protein
MSLEVYLDRSDQDAVTQIGRSMKRERKAPARYGHTVPWTDDLAKKGLRALLFADEDEPEAKKEETERRNGRKLEEKKGKKKKKKTVVAIDTSSPRPKREHKLPSRYID